MDLRRTVIDPKVLQVGFVTRGAPPPPVRSHSVLTDARPTSPAPDISLSGSSLSLVMIPPPRHTSADGLPSLALSAASPLPVSTSPLRRDTVEISMGSYNTSEFFLSSSPTMSPSSRLDAGSELSDEVPTGGRLKDSSRTSLLALDRHDRDHRTSFSHAILTALRRSLPPSLPPTLVLGLEVGISSAGSGSRVAGEQGQGGGTGGETMVKGKRRGKGRGREGMRRRSGRAGHRRRWRPAGGRRGRWRRGGAGWKRGS